MKTTPPRPPITIQDVHNMLTPTEQKNCLDVAEKWEKWLDDPFHNPAPSKNCDLAALIEHKARVNGVEPPIGYDVNVVHARWHLKRIAEEREADPRPNHWDTGACYMWQTREDGRKARENRWMVYLPD